MVENHVSSKLSSLQGKGTITTHFLNGKDGFTKSLPDLCEAAPLTEHEFK